jgi:quaternary ammonium compound-resistance protein SugE
MAWIFLLSAGLLEIVWATALKYADGFTRVWPSVIVLVAATASFFLLALSLKNLPIGTAYAAWTGIGVVGVALIGIVALGEELSPGRIGFITLILVGVVGLRAMEG